MTSIKDKLIASQQVPQVPFNPGDRANLLEVLQRCRRIETRLTRLLETEGIQTGIQRPWWMDDKVMIPSPMTTIDAIIKVIPNGWPNPVPLVLKEDNQMVILCEIIPYEDE